MYCSNARAPRSGGSVRRWLVGGVLAGRLRTVNVLTSRWVMFASGLCVLYALLLPSWIYVWNLI
jgi:hypothetical protein